MDSKRNHSELILICGIPNSGKTTYSSKFDNVIHFDEIQAKTVNERYLKCNIMANQVIGEVCVEGLYNSVRRRVELLDSCPADIKVCIWLNTSLQICLEREKNYRKRPAKIIISQNTHFQPPTYSEGWDEIIIVKDGIGTLMPREENYGGYY